MNQDTNIWDVSENDCIIGKTGFLGGTLNHIIIRLTSGQDSNFLSTFITTYQSFTSPWLLLEKLQQRYHFIIELLFYFF